MSEGARVEMLWEDVPPEAALAERFGMRDVSDAERWVIGVVEQRWGLSALACERLVVSAGNALAWLRSPSGRLVAKWWTSPEHQTRLPAIARMTTWLAVHGVPVSPPVPALDGSLVVGTRRGSLGLQRVLPGRLLDVTDAAQVHAAGVTLARLHLALAAWPEGLPRQAPTSLAMQLDEALASAPAHWPAPAVERLRSLRAALPEEELPVQPVHGDYRSANVLCDGPRVTGVLDLDDARLDHAVADLAQASVLLGTRYRGWGPVSSTVRAGLRSGYESVRPLSPTESAWFDALVLWWSLRFVPPGDDPTGWGAAAAALGEEGR